MAGVLAQPRRDSKAKHVSSVQELYPSKRTWARRALLCSSAAYLLLAGFGLAFALVSGLEVALPNASSSAIVHGLFFAGFMFPAVSVMALIVGWALHSKSRDDAAFFAALVPWAYGSLILALSLRHIF
ncbi:MAG: hypothetical protein AAFU77_14595 [Myxococcota bacterium]